MIMIPALILGVLTGWVRARNRGGSLADKMQYAAAHGLAFFIGGAILTIVLDRMGVF
jgi:hypothetical protein